MILNAHSVDDIDLIRIRSHAELILENIAAARRIRFRARTEEEERALMAVLFNAELLAQGVEHLFPREESRNAS